jgi:hypothetical protein
MFLKPDGSVRACSRNLVAYGNIAALLIQATKELDARVQDRTQVFRVTTTQPDESFSLVAKKPAAPFETSAAFVCGVDAYSRARAAVAAPMSWYRTTFTAPPLDQLVRGPGGSEALRQRQLRLLQVSQLRLVLCPRGSA